MSSNAGSDLSRGELLARAGGLAAAAMVPGLGTLPAAPRAPVPQEGFPRKADFTIPGGRHVHQRRLHHAERRARGGARVRRPPRRLQGVLVVHGLGIPASGGNVVTDALHFEGAIVHLQSLERDAGLDLRIVMPRKDGRIDMADLERIVYRNTRLIEVSLVAMVNGFQHDLKAVCAPAHAHGAHVYADIIQAAGAVPAAPPTSCPTTRPGGDHRAHHHVLGTRGGGGAGAVRPGGRGRTGGGQLCEVFAVRVQRYRGWREGGGGVGVGRRFIHADGLAVACA
jgi:hypothetical protein